MTSSKALPPLISHAPPPGPPRRPGVAPSLANPDVVGDAVVVVADAVVVVADAVVVVADAAAAASKKRFLWNCRLL